MSRFVVLLALILLFSLMTAGCNGPTAPTPIPITSQAPTPTATASQLPTPTATAALAATPTATAPATTQAPAGVASRIQFEPGQTSAAVENSVVLGARDSYTLWVQAGQTMQVTISSLEDNADFIILGPDGQTIKGGEQGQIVEQWQGQLPVTGDYVIIVGATRGNATYRLEVTIPPIATGEATRVVFAPGNAGAILQGDLGPGETDRYVLGATENQSMHVALTTPAGDAVLAVEGANGQVYLSTAAGQSTWSLPALPATQDYILSVVSTGNSTSYVLDVGISALASLPTRIEFAPGTTSATVSGNLATGGDLRYYILRALAGQTIVVESTSTPAPVTAWLQGRTALRSSGPMSRAGWWLNYRPPRTMC